MILLVNYTIFSNTLKCVTKRYNSLLLYYDTLPHNRSYCYTFADKIQCDHVIIKYYNF